MITHWPSPAKLNLFLYITKKRKDGYHDLQTLFQFLDYIDTISIKIRYDRQLNLLTPIFNIANKDNMIIQAARLLRKKAESMHRLPMMESGADFHIKKRLPIGSGLGGGSSNAATVLVALNYLWHCNFTEDELTTFGIKLGSDVPVFIRGYTAFAEGKGEILFPIQLQEKWYLVVYPRVCISTSMVFKNPELPCNIPRRSIETLLTNKFSNVCEIVVRKHFREVDIALSWMSKYAPSRLTGTGSCVFSEFETKSAACQVLRKIPKWLHAFVAKGINLSPLRQVIAMQSKF